MRIAGKTDIGHGRAENQDNFRSGSIAHVAAWGIVCDGMGGATHGKLASQLAVDIIEAAFCNAMEQQVPDAAIKEVMQNAIQRANTEIFIKSGSGVEIMGTTTVCAIVRDNNLHIVHVGDSRAYLYQNRKLQQITKDHSMVQQLVDEGALTPEQARKHPDRNVITRALGVDEQVEAEYQMLTIQPDALILLATDGATNFLSNANIADLLAQTDFYDVPHVMVKEALEAGGNDNITVLLMQGQKGDVTVG